MAGFAPFPGVWQLRQVSWETTAVFFVAGSMAWQV